MQRINDTAWSFHLSSDSQSPWLKNKQGHRQEEKSKGQNKCFHRWTNTLCTSSFPFDCTVRHNILGTKQPSEDCYQKNSLEWKSKPLVLTCWSAQLSVTCYRCPAASGQVPHTHQPCIHPLANSAKQWMEGIIPLLLPSLSSQDNRTNNALWFCFLNLMNKLTDNKMHECKSLQQSQDQQISWSSRFCTYRVL